MTPNADDIVRALGVGPGDVIGGRYELVRVLGAGGTGAVFEARHRVIGRRVAVKLLLPELAMHASVSKRFLQEAQSASEVRHKNIVEVLDFGDDHRRLYMVMEYLEGESLGAFIKREAPMSPARILPLMDPVLSALGAAHARGIVHRDVKPQNVFLAVGPDGETLPKLIDFGIAKRLADADMGLTGTGTVLGTPAYMAPEQAQGARDVTAAADQYAVGAILFHALSRSIPHTADTYPAMLVAIVSQPPQELSALRPDLDPALCAVIMRCLARDPTHRWPDIEALRAALRPFHHLDAPAPSRAAGPVIEGVSSARPSVPTQHPAIVLSGGPPRPVAPLPLPGSEATSHPTRASRSLAGVTVAAVIAALAMLSLAIGLSMRPAPSPPAIVPLRAAADASRPTPREMVTFSIDVQPPNASITLDGELIGNGHAEVMRPRDGARHQLTLSAPGHAVVTDVLVASGDARVSRVLASLEAPRAPRPVTVVLPAPAPAPAPTPAPTPAPRPDLRHPNIDRRIPF